MSDVNGHNAVCPNCNTELKGEFCYVCGQQRIHQPETVGHFVRHFFDDITHFDSKFFQSLLPLLFKPGYLTAQYMAGRRARYLHPIRAYLFLSFIYFFLLFSFGKTSEELTNVPIISLKAQHELDSLKTSGREMQIAIDSIHSQSKTIKALIDSLKGTNAQVKLVLDSLQHEDEDSFAIDMFHLNAKSNDYLDTLTMQNFEAEQRSLPDSLRESWINTLLIKKTISNKDKYHGDAQAVWRETISKLIHNIPKMLFFLLPVFALFLKLFYARRRIYYVSHAIFSLHYFSFIFIVFSLSIIIQKFIHVPWFGFVTSILMAFYLYKAMRNFYKQNRAKTILKFSLLYVSFSFVIIFAFIVSLFISFLSL